MPTTLAAKRYAKALFQLSVEQGLLDTVHGELHQVLELQQNSKEYADLASHRVITVEGRKKNIRLALEGRVNPLVLRFLLFLAEKHRHDIFADIVGEFDGLFNEAKGILDIRVISAHPL
ncbi:MAG TPA: ATP synthase F1 subunit delta, partial [Kiritimatiellia bacterium]